MEVNSIDPFIQWDSTDVLLIYLKFLANSIPFLICEINSGKPFFNISSSKAVNLPIPKFDLSP